MSVKHCAILAALLLLLTGCASAPRETAPAEASASPAVGESTLGDEAEIPPSSAPEEAASVTAPSEPQEPEEGASEEEPLPTPDAAAAEESAAAPPAPQEPEEGASMEESTVPEAQETGAIPGEWDEATTFQHTLCFTGDINLAEGQYTTAALDSDGLKSCVGKRLRKEMKKADVLCVNNEFSYTTRGTPLEGKAFTFRSNPSRTQVLKDLGADVAILANNHVFDYGEEGLADTLDALDEAGIARIGAGRNLKEASAIHYQELEGCTVAFLAATRVEWSAQTQPATKKGIGVFYTAYDTDLLYQRVKEAKEKADFVVVCMHWGIEGTGDLEEYQTQVGKGLVDAGADLVVGDHPHVLQGVELAEEVPVFYSLGNYWFNRREEYTMLLKVELRGDKYGLRQVRCRIIPAWQSGAKVKALTEEDEQRAMYDYLESLPGSNVRIDKKGYVNKR